MNNVKLFEAFSKEGPHNYYEITIEDILALRDSEIGWMVWNFPRHEGRAFGQWEAKQPEEFRSIYKKMIDADMEHGLVDEDAAPMGKYLKKEKNRQVLTDLVALFNRKYPGVDYRPR